MDSSSEEQEITTKRPSRSRTASARAPRAARATRVRAQRGSAEVRREVPPPKPEVHVPEPSDERKAPTPFAADRAVKARKNKRLLVVSVLILLGVGTSAAIGLTDAGEIDVEKTIEARNERIRNNQMDERDILTSSMEVPVQNTPVQKADGGLRGFSAGDLPPPPPVEAATTTASSTGQTASSTEMTASSTDQVEGDPGSGSPEIEASSGEAAITQ